MQIQVAAQLAVIQIGDESSFSQQRSFVGFALLYHAWEIWQRQWPQLGIVSYELAHQLLVHHRHGQTMPPGQQCQWSLRRQQLRGRYQMPIETAAHNILQLRHLAMIGARMVQHDNGAFGKISHISLRGNVLVGAIDGRQWTEGAAV